MFRILFGLILIYIGFRVMVRTSCCGRVSKGDVVFHEATVQAGEGNSYRVVFGRAEFDLREKGVKDGTVQVQTVFGSSRIQLDPAVPTRVSADAAFASVRLPDGGVTAMGKAVYKNKAWKQGKPALEVHVHSVFGEVEVVETSQK